MNWDQTHGNWMQMSGKLRERWGKMTGDEQAKRDGKRDQIAGLLQQRYGDARAKLEKQLEKFAR